MKNKWSLIVITGFLLTAVRSYGDDKTLPLDGQQVTLAHYAKALIGEGNVKVEIAPYTAGAKKGAILVFHGVEGDWDGKAVNHELKDEGYGSSSYNTAYKGKEWHTLQIKAGDGKPVYSLFPAGTQDEISLVASDGAAQLTSPKAIYDEYLQQQAAAKK